MERPPEEGNTVCLFDDLAQIHDGDLVADILDDGEIVRDEQVGQADFPLQRPQEIEDLRLDGDVERGHRLVAHDEVGLAGERTRDPDPLPLAAGKLVRKQCLLFGAQPDLPEQVGDPVVAVIRIADIHKVQRLANDRAGAHARAERGIGILENDLGPPAQGPEARCPPPRTGAHRPVRWSRA